MPNTFAVAVSEQNTAEGELEVHVRHRSFEHITEQPQSPERNLKARAPAWSDLWPGDWLEQFHSDYPNGVRVTKRGLEASAMVIKKYDLSPMEAVSFSHYVDRSEAFTVFHFHPTFPLELRRRYMDQHEEGLSLIHEGAARQDHAKEQARTEAKAAFTKRFKSTRRVLQTLVTKILASPQLNR